MIVLKQLNNTVKSTENTLHNKVDRNERITAYKHLLSFEFIACFVVDTKHKNGLEIHCINENGLIYIHNKQTRKLVTILHPRPSQLKRYFRQLNIKIPETIQTLSKQCYQRNQEKGYNHK